MAVGMTFSSAPSRPSLSPKRRESRGDLRLQPTKNPPNGVPASTPTEEGEFSAAARNQSWRDASRARSRRPRGTRHTWVVGVRRRARGAVRPLVAGARTRVRRACCSGPGVPARSTVGSVRRAARASRSRAAARLARSDRSCRAARRRGGRSAAQLGRTVACRPSVVAPSYRRARLSARRRGRGRDAPRRRQPANRAQRADPCGGTVVHLSGFAYRSSHRHEAVRAVGTATA